MTESSLLTTRYPVSVLNNNKNSLHVNEEETYKALTALKISGRVNGCRVARHTDSISDTFLKLWIVGNLRLNSSRKTSDKD